VKFNDKKAFALAPKKQENRDESDLRRVETSANAFLSLNFTMRNLISNIAINFCQINDIHVFQKHQIAPFYRAPDGSAKCGLVHDLNRKNTTS
jgi:hypothetical protein